LQWELDVPAVENHTRPFSQAKAMYAYVDETGNTGNGIFDPQQPLFITAAMMTRTNFDAVRTQDVKGIAKKLGVDVLHAKELGVGKIEEVADDLLKVVKEADARFFVSRLEKRYLATAKVYDTYFDAGENLAVPWHAYWIRPLRLMLMFKLAEYVITEEIARTVWDCITAPNERKSKAFFVEGAKAMLLRAPNLPDQRSCQIVTEALEWAIKNPESFSTHIRDKINRNSHSPNFVAFSNLMDGLDQTAKAWKRPVREIVHDRQHEFEKTLIQWHEVYSRPELVDVKPLYWPGEKEPLSLSKTPGSKFRIDTEGTSAGLQVIDVVLWLFNRVVNDKNIGPCGARLLKRALQRGLQNDLSFDGVGEFVEQKLDEIWNSPMTDEQIAEGAAMMAREQESRIEAMRDYLAQKALPTDR
jgi:hypothetical protein